MQKVSFVRIQSTLNAVAALSVIAASASIMWLLWSLPERPRAGDARRNATASATGILPAGSVSLRLKDVAIKGNVKASVGVIAYSDFQCPYCAVFARDTLPLIDRNYIQTGRAFLAFRHFPLEAIHPAAVSAAVAADCSRYQGRFWAIHDALFARPKELATLNMTKFAIHNGLDADEFEKCFNREEQRAVIMREVSEARALGITRTPTFFFGTLDDEGLFRVTRSEIGAIPYRAFAKLLEETIAVKTPPS